MARAPESGTAAGGIFLGQTSYGKSDVRLVKVKRGKDRHELTDVRVDVALEGDFEAAYTRGDNTNLLATDTMRNTVRLAKDHLTGDRGVRQEASRALTRGRTDRRARPGTLHRAPVGPDNGGRQGARALLRKGSRGAHGDC